MQKITALLKIVSQEDYKNVRKWKSQDKHSQKGAEGKTVIILSQGVKSRDRQLILSQGGKS